MWKVDLLCPKIRGSMRTIRSVMLQILNHCIEIEIAPALPSMREVQCYGERLSQHYNETAPSISAMMYQFLFELARRIIHVADEFRIGISPHITVLSPKYSISDPMDPMIL